MSDLMNLKEAIVNGKLEEAKAIVNEALEAGVDRTRREETGPNVR